MKATSEFPVAMASTWSSKTPSTAMARSSPTVAVKLGVWRSNMRSRRERLAPEQQAGLDEVGL
ncbi:hypothetical protein [Streptomyces sp. NPDC127098]|uniref:hypothetical protein n=1 Tax=Streptomyces sp. NPDC127098 TaxID=3347137 RepID=UPI00366A2CFE